MRAKPQFRMMLGAALAVLALTAVAATAAQAATEGPFYNIAGTRLASGETANVSAKAEFHYTVDLGGTSFIQCGKMSYSTGAKITGSSGASSSGTTTTISFAECGGPEENCKVENNGFSTNPLTGTLGYATATRTGKLLELFAPSTGQTFATIKFVGSHCLVVGEQISMLGKIIGGVSTKTGPIEVGGETKGVASLERAISG